MYLLSKKSCIYFIYTITNFDKFFNINIVQYSNEEVEMRKIGGVNMNAIAQKKYAKEKTSSERYCTVYKSLEESLKEVKEHREGKTNLFSN